MLGPNHMKESAIMAAAGVGLRVFTTTPLQPAMNELLLRVHKNPRTHFSTIPWSLLMQLGLYMHGLDG